MSAQDPRNKFKSTDYEQQEQPLPGLQSQLTPEPDCGETSYVGHGRLKGYKMLVHRWRFCHWTRSSYCLC